MSICRRSAAGWLISLLFHTVALGVLAVAGVSEAGKTVSHALTGIWLAREPVWETLSVEITAHSNRRKPHGALLLQPEVAADELSAMLAAPLIASDDLPRRGGPVAGIAALRGLGETIAETTATDAQQGGAEFFGVPAAGTRFVFVVDCSRSMAGTKWNLARRELMECIERIGPSRCYYVIFFDNGTHRMFEPRPAKDLVPATAENIIQLRQWVAAKNLGYGTKPCRSIEFALRLRPDVIYLLSDGEFTDPTVGFLRRHNRDSETDKPIVRVHTIGFHSHEGRRLLQRIAEENGGTYQSVSHADPRQLGRAEVLRAEQPEL